MLLLNISILTILLLIFIQDIKHHAIHIALPIVLIVLGSIKYNWQGWAIAHLVSSLFFLIMVLLGLILYVSIKFKKPTNPFDTLIGWGDILFFIAVIPLFHLTTYMLYFISGLLIAAIIHIALGKKKEQQLPLAGYLSIYLIGLQLINMFLSVELFYNNIFI